MADENKFNLAYTGTQINEILAKANASTAVPAVESSDKDKYLHTNASTGALEWSAVASSSGVSSLGGATGAITLGSGLSMSGNELSATGTGDMSNPMTAKGDIIVGGTSGTPTKLAKGTSGQVLMMNTAGTTPEWKTPSTISDTWRPVQVNGSEILGSSTSSSVLNLKAGSNVTLTNSSGEVTIAATDTTYTSESAASGGTTLSLVTTGEKYTWNEKQAKLTTTYVNDGTINKSIGFDVSGNLVKGTVGGGGSSTWGSISGDINSQIDLRDALAEKYDIFESSVFTLKTLSDLFANSMSLVNGRDAFIIKGNSAKPSDYYFVKLYIDQPNNQNFVYFKSNRDIVSYVISETDYPNQDIFTTLNDKTNCDIDKGIKTLASTSLLGTGNIALKTINNTSLIGSGDITVSALPTIVNDRFLHTNASTGNLEWREGQLWESYSDIWGDNCYTINSPGSFPDYSLQISGNGLTLADGDLGQPSTKSVFNVVNSSLVLNDINNGTLTNILTVDDGVFEYNNKNVVTTTESGSTIPSGSNNQILHKNASTGAWEWVTAASLGQITLDNTPTNGSTNGVTSGGVYTALQPSKIVKHKVTLTTRDGSGDPDEMTELIIYAVSNVDFTSTPLAEYNGSNNIVIYPYTRVQYYDSTNKVAYDVNLSFSWENYSGNRVVTRMTYINTSGTIVNKLIDEAGYEGAQNEEEVIAYSDVIL